MDSKAADERFGTLAENTHSANSLHSNKDNITSPPSSVNATEPDSARSANGLLFGRVAGSEQPDSRTFVSAHGGANAGI